MLQSKLQSETSLPNECPQVKLLLKSMIVDSTLKLTRNDWIKEQMDDTDMGKVTQLLKTNRLKIHLEPVTQFVLPKRFICKVILTCHDDNGHLEMERTLGLLQERFLWPKMAEDVCIHICTCDRCLKFKQPQEKAEMQPILVSYPMELIHLDFLTLGRKAEDTKNVNILIVTDHFTKYAQAYITSKQTAIVVGHTLWENFLVHCGWPEKILTDQGKSFENNLI